MPRMTKDLRSNPPKPDKDSMLDRRRRRFSCPAILPAAVSGDLMARQVNGLPVLSPIHSSVCLDCFVRVLDVESRTPGNQNVADGLQAGVQPHPIDTLQSAIDLNFPSPK